MIQVVVPAFDNNVDTIRSPRNCRRCGRQSTADIFPVRAGQPIGSVEIFVTKRIARVGAEYVEAIWSPRCDARTVVSNTADIFEVIRWQPTLPADIIFMIDGITAAANNDVDTTTSPRDRCRCRRVTAGAIAVDDEFVNQTGNAA